MYVLIENIKKNHFFPMKFLFFTAEKNSILNGQVFVMTTFSGQVRPSQHLTNTQMVSQVDENRCSVSTPALCVLSFRRCYRRNQRTNVPIKAHLRSGIYTKIRLES